jgi:hypothetical protein
MKNYHFPPATAGIFKVVENYFKMRISMRMKISNFPRLLAQAWRVRKISKMFPSNSKNTATTGAVKIL